MERLKKTLKIEYFLIPTPASNHISDYMYRVIDQDCKWLRHTLPLRILNDDVLLAEYILDLVSTFGYSKVRLYECKLVRKRNDKRTNRSNG